MFVVFFFRHFRLILVSIHSRFHFPISRYYLPDTNAVQNLLKTLAYGHEDDRGRMTSMMKKIHSVPVMSGMMGGIGTGIGGMGGGVGGGQNGGARG